MRLGGGGGDGWGPGVGRGCMNECVRWSGSGTWTENEKESMIHLGALGVGWDRGWDVLDGREGWDPGGLERSGREIGSGGGTLWCCCMSLLETLILVICFDLEKRRTKVCQGGFKVRRSEDIRKV